MCSLCSCNGYFTTEEKNFQVRCQTARMDFEDLMCSAECGLETPVLEASSLLLLNRVKYTYLPNLD